jgi:Subtilase family
MDDDEVCVTPGQSTPRDARSSSNPGVSWRHAETSAITDTEHWLLRPPGGKWGYRILAKPRPPFVIASAAAAPAVQLGWGRAPSDATALSLRVQAGYDAVDGGDADDCNGHGTHMAGIVGGETYGVVKDISLHPVRILNCSASGTAAGGAAGSSGRSTISRALSRPP